MIEQLQKLPLEQKIGQLFVVGLPGTENNAETSSIVNEIKPGGVCLFSRNIREAAQTRDLLNSVRDSLPVVPLLSLDQEGGLVDRLRRVLGPSPQASKIRTAEDAGLFGQLTSEAIRILGFNTDFAPVIDVVDDRRSKFSNGLHSRAYGSSVSDVVDLAGSFARALQDGGCIACFKHFPGLGASEIDSHEDLPAVNITQDEFESIDLRPYRELLSSDGAVAVMVAHAAYPLLDLQETDQNGKLLPSSLSFNVVTKLLREGIGFDGVVLTDDLEMGAIVRNYGIGDACVRAINAGVDMLAICAGKEAIYEGFNSVVAAARSGDLDPERIDRSLARIARMKSQIVQPLPFDPARLKVLSEEIAALGTRLNS